MIGNAVPKLPVSKDHALIGGKLQGLAAGKILPFTQGTCDTPSAAARVVLRCGKEDGKVGEVIVQDELGRGSIFPAKRVAQAAVDAAKAFRFLLRKVGERGPYITKHR